MTERSENNLENSLLKQTYLEHSLQHITEEFVRQTRELSLVKKISKALIYSTNPEKVCLAITEVVLEEVHSETCSLFLIDEATENLNLKAESSHESPEGTYYDKSEKVIGDIYSGLAGTVLKSGKPKYIKNAGKSRKYKDDLLFSDGMLSVLCLPLISGRHKIGILLLLAPEANAFDKDDRDLLQVVVNDTANVLRNVQLLNSLKDAEKQLEEYSKDLEGKIEKRTKELILSEKLSSVGQLVAGVAHELNNPLAIILGYIDILTPSKGISSKDKKRLDKIREAALRSAKIVNNLLKFSRKEKLERKNISTNEIIQDTLNLFDYQLRINNIKVINNLDNQIPWTAADPQQLQQVFLNLITNSFDSLLLKKGVRKLEVKSSLDKDMIVIEVSDTGIGIDKENSNKIFEPFYTTKEVGKGTGLGLSLSYGIIKEHFGEIYLDKSVKKGAKFVIKLPVIEEKSIKEHRQESDNYLSDKTAILLVDDEEDVLLVQKDILNSFSCSIDISKSGIKALDLALNNEYDIIVSDIKMPGKIDGIGLYHEIKKSKPGMEKKMVFITGDIVGSNTKGFLKSVNNYYIEKPFTADNFIDLLNRSLQKAN
ncbi:ATP-binding protein [candidate division KSB1 bacterium]